MSKKSQKPLPVTQVMKDGKKLVQLKDVLDAQKSGDQALLTSLYIQMFDEIATGLNKTIETIHALNIVAIDNAMNNSNSFELMTQAVIHAEKAQAIRHARLRQWFEEHTPAVWDTKKKRFVTDTEKATDAYDIEHAKEHPWYEKQEVIQEPYNLESVKRALETIIKRSNSDKANAEQKAQLKAIADMLNDTAMPALEQSISEAMENASNDQADTEQVEQAA